MKFKTITIICYILLLSLWAWVPLANLIDDAHADQTFNYSGGNYDTGRLSDELVAAGITPITIRAVGEPPTSIDIVVADGVSQAAVNAVVAAHNPATSAPLASAKIRRNAANTGWEVQCCGGPWEGVILIPVGGTTGQVLTKQSATNYDVIWTTPSAGGGPQVARKTSDQSNSSTSTLVDVAEQSFSVSASTAYHFRFTVFYTSAAAATGIVLSVDGPASPTYLQYGAEICESATVRRYLPATTYNTALIGTASGTAVVMRAVVEGYLLNGSNAGTLKLRFRTEVNASAVTIKRGSFAELY